MLGYKRVKNESYGKGTIAVLDPETAPEVYKIFQVIHEKRPTVEQMVRFLNKNHVLNTRWTAPKLVRLIDNHLYYGRLKRNGLIRKTNGMRKCARTGIAWIIIRSL